MNLSQMKQALEASVINALKNSVSDSVIVNAIYDANNGIMTAELIEEKQLEKEKSSILCYNIKYAEETNSTTIVAFNRVYLHDSLGVSIASNEAIPISSDFMKNITQIIVVGMDMVYHPENYQIAEDDNIMNVATESVDSAE